MQCPHCFKDDLDDRATRCPHCTGRIRKISIKSSFKQGVSKVTEVADSASANAPIVKTRVQNWFRKWLGILLNFGKLGIAGIFTCAVVFAVAFGPLALLYLFLARAEDRGSPADYGDLVKVLICILWSLYFMGYSGIRFERHPVIRWVSKGKPTGFDRVFNSAWNFAVKSLGAKDLDALRDKTGN